MDIRVKKTRRSIITAFMELRAHKPLEKITVKELCEKAEINKSTFYTHFTDIYHLSDQLEQELIQQVVDNLPHPQYVVEHPKEFTQELFLAFYAQSARIDKLFSGPQRGNFVVKLHTALKERISQAYPQYEADLFFNVYLNFAIFGGYYAMCEGKAIDTPGTIAAIAQITEHCSRALVEELHARNQTD